MSVYTREGSWRSVRLGRGVRLQHLSSAPGQVSHSPKNFGSAQVMSSSGAGWPITTTGSLAERELRAVKGVANAMLAALDMAMAAADAEAAKKPAAVRISLYLMLIF